MDAVDRIAVGEPPPQPTTIVRASLGDMVALVPQPAATPTPAPAPAEAPPTGK
jgi:hypothetical protein